MNYQEFIGRVQALDFVQSAKRADAQTKAVLGILASNLDESLAREMTSRLPEPLTLELLRGHQRRVGRISAEDYLAELEDQFHIDRGQSRQLVQTVIHNAKEAAGTDLFARIEKAISPDLAALLDQA